MMSNPLSPDPNQNLLPSTSFSTLNWEPQETNPTVILQSDLLIGHINQNPNIPAVTPNPSDSLLLAQIEGSIATIDPNITLPNDNSFDGLTGEAMDIVKEQLTQFAKVPNFVEKMNLAFGESWDNQAANVLTEDWLNGDFSLIPPVKFVSSAEIGGANGAFAAATDTIYLSRELLTGNGANPAAVANVLLEEIGHSVDARLNVTDTPGDEGAIFAAVVQGKELSLETLTKLKSENDQVAVTIDGQSLIIEQDNTPSLALNIGTLSGTRSFSGWVGSTDTNDYYRFYVGSTSNFNLTLNGLSADADVQLLDANNGLIQSSTHGSTTAESIGRTLSPGTYYARVYPYGAANTNYNLSLSVPIIKPTVSLSVTDSSAAETTSGQTANPGRFTVTRTGITTNPLTVYYTTGGTAIKGTDYQNLIGSVTIPAGSTTATIPINVIDDGLVEGSETAIVNLSTNTNYNLGTTSGTVTIADNDVVTKPTVSLTTTDSSAAETTSGQTANPGRFTVTRTGITTNPLTVYYTTGGTATKGTDYQNLLGSVTIPAGSTTATIPINVIDDGLVEGSETAIINLSANTNYNSGTGGNNIDFGDTSGTVTIADNDVNIPSTSWKAEYFNNVSLSGTPVFTENLGSGSQGFSKNWSGSSPASSVPVDNFSGRMTTQRYFAPGLYQIKVQADDGVRVKIGNESVIDRWLPQSFVTNSGYFRSNGGTVPITVDYYEQGGDAAINFSITPATKFWDSVDTSTQWQSTVYSWNSSQGTPLTNFWEGDFNSPNAIGVINLGSNTRSDGKKGINVNWGQGAPNGDGNRLPHDFFAMRSYTQADFDGSPYKFRVQGDDGFQLLAVNQGTGQWYNITPANQWTQSYSPTEITYQLPAGRYYMHFHQYEGGGDARFDLSWDKVAVSSPLVSSTQQANAFFKVQYWNNPYNLYGPNSSTNCGPASLAMIRQMFGMEQANISDETSIDHARYLMFGYSNGTSQGVTVLNQDTVWTSFDNVKNGIRNSGGTPEELTGWDNLDRSLNAGKPVINYGTLTDAWRGQFPSRVGSGSGGHWNAILGKSSDGKYIVADPMHEGGTVAMTRSQLSVFNANPSFIAFAR
ncbi:Calx-beta domain-containing protein [Planktothrix mougeotii]|uniref:Pre-peptidase C-terminal domain-containing protein n=1 Tax=Planktothrix mougeotii LEGE 06226 TaxID=1828728 RepID=A0ABR9U6S2_9CYAN|nr:Calx-beta domain-containing protein [Planktothrix mougeotii]MBE9141881.1 pre-peptidase C-terminal domain-containing protein [Planktothrix mougeotii LEGE 06226]